MIREPQHHWWTEAIFYEVYLPSFADSNADGIGDLRGLMFRLDHLRGGRDSLNVDALWISPFYPSGGRDGGYDVTDYTAVSPWSGTMDDFDRLIEACHERGLRVLIDWIPSHTSNLHPWFIESRSSRNSQLRDWYVWRDGREAHAPPNNWRSFFAPETSAWTYDDHTRQFYLHSFSTFQPDLNWENPDVREKMYGIFRFWLDRGIDGFRIDSLPFLGKNPSLADNADQDGPWGKNNLDWPSVHSYVKDLRSIASAYGDIALVGEVNLTRFARILPYVCNDELSLALTFSLVSLEWSAENFRDTLISYEKASVGRIWPAWYLNNHDHSRAVTRYEDGSGIGENRARGAAVLLLTLACTPFLYQGEELGLANVALPSEFSHDLAHRDAQRTPFPWEAPSSAGPGAGFTSRKPWLPIGDQAGRKNRASEITALTSLLNLYRHLIRTRRESPALTHGTSRFFAAPPGVLAYERETFKQKVVVAVNFSDEPQEVKLPSVRAHSLLLTSFLDQGTTINGHGFLHLRPNEAVVLDVDNVGLAKEQDHEFGS